MESCRYTGQGNKQHAESIYCRVLYFTTLPDYFTLYSTSSLASGCAEQGGFLRHMIWDLLIYSYSVQYGWILSRYLSTRVEYRVPINVSELKSAESTQHSLTPMTAASETFSVLSVLILSRRRSPGGAHSEERAGVTCCTYVLIAIHIVYIQHSVCFVCLIREHSTYLLYFTVFVLFQAVCKEYVQYSTD